MLEVQHQCSAVGIGQRRQGGGGHQVVGCEYLLRKHIGCQGFIGLEPVADVLLVVHGGSGQCVRIRIVGKVGHRIGIEQWGGDRCRSFPGAGSVRCCGVGHLEVVDVR